jgi:hypothetical protein
VCMNKFYYCAVLLLITSCTGMPTQLYQESFLELRSSLFKPSMDSSKKFFEGFPYSYAIIRIGNSKPARIVLSSISTNIFEWVSADGVKIYTLEGKVIRTLGLERDIDLITERVKFNKTSQQNVFLDLYNPEAINIAGIQSVTIGKEETIFFLEQPIDVLSAQERIFFKAINWTQKSQYYLRDGQVIKSVQKFHPLMPKIEIQFYFK